MNVVSEDWSEARFDGLARRLFAQQFTRNAPYRRYCDALGVTPDGVGHWSQIPAVPAAAFKRFALTCAPEADCALERGGRIFHSSGTTGQETSRHFLDGEALDVYRTSLRKGYRRFVPDGPVEILALMPSADAAPHSSLSFMLAVLGATFLWGDDWTERLVDRLRAAAEPVTLFGTAFAFVHFLDALGDRPCPLPTGSVVIETGGFKGRSREIAREELYRFFVDRLCVPWERCLSEYGMSEMASQFYAIADGPKQGPPWVRTRVLDPISAQEAPVGEPGLLVHYDLANVNSVLAIETQDWGYAVADGGFVLLGRAPGAPLRGCSLGAENDQT